MDSKITSKIWRIFNAVMAIFFLCLIADAWIQILYFKRAEKHFYYLATLLFIPFLTCLVVVLDWDLDTLKG